MRILFVAVLAALLAQGEARADADDTLNLAVGGSVMRDNNLFRLPDGVYPPAFLGSTARSETVRSGSASLTYDKKVSLQSFHFGTSLSDNRYENFRALDFIAKGYDTHWDWQLDPSFSGRFSADRSQSLYPFTDYRGFQRNIQTIQNYGTTAEFGSLGWLRLFGGVNDSKIEMSQVVVQIGDYNTHAAYTGLKFVSDAYNSIALLSRVTRVDWLHRSLDLVGQNDIRAYQHDSELQAYWQIEGKTLLQATVTRLERTHPNTPVRDYDGTGAHFDLTWNATAKTQLLLTAARDYAAWWDSASSYTVTNRVAVTPVWQPTAKTQAKLRLERSSRDFLGPPFPATFVGPARRDGDRVAQLALDWLPERSLSFEASLTRDNRDSNAAGLSYADTTVMVSAQLSF